MLRRRVLVALVSCAVLGSTLTTAASARQEITAPVAQPCVFRFGFEALHDEIPMIVGDCTSNETYNPANGDGLQTTTHGLLVWRKADNWTAFTTGVFTWINGPYGVWARPNSGRFCWEPDNDPEFCYTEPFYPVFTFE